MNVGYKVSLNPGDLLYWKFGEQPLVFRKAFLEMAETWLERSTNRGWNGHKCEVTSWQVLFNAVFVYTDVTPTTRFFASGLYVYDTAECYYGDFKIVACCKDEKAAKNTARDRNEAEAYRRRLARNGCAYPGCSNRKVGVKSDTYCCSGCRWDHEDSKKAQPKRRVAA